MTKAKMRGRQWSVEAAPQMGSAGSTPVASPSPPYSSENQFTAPTGPAAEPPHPRATFHAGKGRRGHRCPPPPRSCFDSPQGPPPPRLGLLGALMAEEG